MDMDKLAARLGTDLAGLDKVLDRLWADVAGSADITDAHPRFDSHIGLMHVAGDTDPDLDDQMDRAGSDPAQYNRITRGVIRRIKTELA